MSQVFQQLCETLSSSMDRNELYKVAKQLGLDVNSTMTKADFCKAVSGYAISQIDNLKDLLNKVSNYNNKGAQKGGYFSEELNTEIDEDLGVEDSGEPTDYADDEYDYDANDENDEDIEDSENSDIDETAYQVGGGNQRHIQKKRQLGGYIPIRDRLNNKNKSNNNQKGGNLSIRDIEIGLLNEKVAEKLLKELAKLEEKDQSVSIEFIKDLNRSKKNNVTGMIRIKAQNLSQLEKLRRQVAELVTLFEDQNIYKSA